MSDEKEVIFKITRSIKKNPNKDYCTHRHAVVDEKFRTVECRDCGAVVDPFEFILRWANEEHRFEMEVEYKKRELTKIFEEIAELKKTVSYLKKKQKVKAGHQITEHQPLQPEARSSETYSPF